MLKFLLKVLFKPSHRPKAKANNKPIKETRVPIAGRDIAASCEKTTTAQPDGVEKGAAFDAATAHSVKLPVVLEGPAYVIDGDTVTIHKTQVRLWGIDAPELNHPYGQTPNGP
jgi:endonuclease YncB( thermonuclease family)